MMKSFTSFFIILILLPLFSSCSTFNCTRLEGLLGGNVNLISLAEKITDNLVDEALPPLIPRHPELPILTSTFVYNDDLKQTSRFGRLLQEHIGARLVQRGYTVREVKLRDTMQITPGSGEKMLSREISKITADQPAQATLVGTYSLINRTLYISARLVNPINKNILSAHSYKLCMDDNLLAMFGLQRQMEDQDIIEAPSESTLNKIFY